jgi:hypothetical protein
MKKIFSITFFSFLGLSLFAFEGVIKQTFTDFSTKKFVNQFTWHIKGDKIKLQITSQGQSVFLIPDIKNDKLIIYNDREDEDGNKWYMEFSSAEIKSSIGMLEIAERKEIKYQGETAHQIKAKTENGVFVLDVLPSIDINLALFAGFLKESLEVQIIAKAGLIGFPVTSKAIQPDGEVTLLTTQNISKQTVSDKEFMIPVGYQKYEVSGASKN